MPDKAIDVLLLTEDRYEDPQVITPYVQNVLTEDGLVKRALENLNLKVVRKSWSAPDLPLDETRIALFRTTWDYFNQYPAFCSWLEKAKGRTRFINPLELIQWNMDKHYLLELAESGLPVPPTRIIHRGEHLNLRKFLQESGWNRLVLKPTVSGGGKHTHLVNPDNASEYQSVLEELLEGEDMMLQEFQEQIYQRGEVALMVFNGGFTHAILKKGKKGDFRVQDDWGGTVHPYKASPEEIKFAEEVVSFIQPNPLYARVDLVWDNKNRPVVIEVELIEPELWFRRNPPAADELAKGIHRVL